VGTLFRREFDHRDAAAGLEVLREILQIECAILDVMQHVVNERHVHVVRHARVRRLADDALDVGQSLFGRRR
jgi:hypothetical protein